jgi:hypothetical protein
MVTLLRDDFGFHPSSVDITFTFMFLVDGSKVKWSLVMSLALHAAEHEAKYESESEYELIMGSNVTYEESNVTHDDSCETQMCTALFRVSLYGYTIHNSGSKLAGGV